MNDDISIPEVARNALAILDRDGWNKGAVTLRAGYEFSLGYPVGSHCIGGAWNMALSSMRGLNAYEHELDHWHGEQEYYDRMIEIIRDEWPERYFEKEAFGFSSAIAFWNNHKDTTEAEVRRLLEKLAAG